MRLAACLFLLIPFGFTTGTAFAQQVGERILVTTPCAELRSLEKTTGTVQQGTILAVKHVNGDWFWVIHPDRDQVSKGWIHRADVVAYSQALEFLTAELASHPTAALYDARGTIWRERRDLDRAIADWSEALRLDPRDVTALVHRGDALKTKAAADTALAASIEQSRTPRPADWRPAGPEKPLVTQTGARPTNQDAAKAEFDISLVDWSAVDDRLELRNTVFCQHIANYGNWQPLSRKELTAGQPVLVYCEVENFKSQRTAEDTYRTTLKSTIEILDGDGQLVQTMPFEPCDDHCKRHRRDYYNSYEFSIPRNCQHGPHTLKLTVKDELSHQSATSTVAFEVK